MKDFVKILLLFDERCVIIKSINNHSKEGFLTMADFFGAIAAGEIGSIPTFGQVLETFCTKFPNV